MDDSSLLVCVAVYAGGDEDTCRHVRSCGHFHANNRGYNIGIRLIDEFLAKTKTTKCGGFRDTMEVVAKQVRWSEGGEGGLFTS
jgi:hypothetical protein